MALRNSNKIAVLPHWKESGDHAMLMGYKVSDLFHSADTKKDTPTKRYMTECFLYYYHICTIKYIWWFHQHRHTNILWYSILKHWQRNIIIHQRLWCLLVQWALRSSLPRGSLLISDGMQNSHDTCTRMTPIARCAPMRQDGVLLFPLHRSLVIQAMLRRGGGIKVNMMKVCKRSTQQLKLRFIHVYYSHFYFLLLVHSCCEFVSLNLYLSE